ncbi:inositol polyphosphate multikinase IPK2-like [Canna indica]|uniref:Inositol polyphosphate multikinase n=1 Tax=Canna indica TaxID=4628 RepID=A0AAQ3Q9J1_9LILI|nr:inositol polyphosphate multikinase IPK2-like [Canna indica]
MTPNIYTCRRSLYAIPRGTAGVLPTLPMAEPMLKPPEHQVAGHRTLDGKLGPLVDGRGLFYKPLQGDGRGKDEVTFYSVFSSHPAVPPRILSFFPRFHGTHVLPSSDGSGPRPHLALEDLVAGFRFPSLIDIKIGARTWPLGSSDDYFRKCIARDRESTTASLGFRISGVQIQDPRAAAGFWRPSKSDVRVYLIPDTRRVLRQFVSMNPPSDGAKPDCGLASAVYGGPDGVLAQLRELKEWFEEQTLLHFYSASVLVVYEKDAVAGQQPEGSSGVRLKLVDFAHVEEGNGVIDHNFFGGLCSLIKFISDVINDPEGDGWKSNRVQLSCENGNMEKNGNLMP